MAKALEKHLDEVEFFDLQDNPLPMCDGDECYDLPEVLDFRKKVANIIYAGAMLGVAGYGIYHSLSHLTGVKEAATAMVELAEEGASVVEIVEAGLESANVADALTIGKD